jgi:hypothetical protein
LPEKKFVEQAYNQTFLGEIDESHKNNLNQGVFEDKYYFGKKIEVKEKKYDCIIMDTGEILIDYTPDKKKKEEDPPENQIKQAGLNYQTSMLPLENSWSKLGLTYFIAQKAKTPESLSVVSAVSEVQTEGKCLMPPISEYLNKAKKQAVEAQQTENDLAYTQTTQTTPLNLLNSMAPTQTTLTAFPKALFDSILKVQEYYMDVHDKRSLLLTTSFVLTSYCFELFDAVGYLFFNSDKASGKTKFAKILELLCFNSQNLTSPSQAVMFRIIEQTKGTFFVDDYENLPEDWQSVTDQILKVGYKKGGKTARAVKIKDGFDVEWFDVYSPKVVTNTTSLDSVTLSRCIPIHLLPTDSNKGKLFPESRDFFWEYLRDCCYVFVMHFWRQVKENYLCLDVSELNNREMELARPLLAVAYTVDRAYFEQLKGYLVSAFEERDVVDSFGSWELSLYHVLDSVAGDGDWYNVKWVTKELRSYLQGDDDSGEAKLPGYRWVGRQLSKVPLFDKRRVADGMQYYISQDLVQRYLRLKRIKFDEKTEEKQEGEK